MAFSTPSRVVTPCVWNGMNGRSPALWIITCRTVTERLLVFASSGR